MKNLPALMLFPLMASLGYACGNTHANDVAQLDAESNTFEANAPFQGKSMVANAGDANSAQCAHGGHLLDYGVDTNANGVLDASEITGSLAVCNGAPGAAGAAGANGSNGANGNNSPGEANMLITPLLNGSLAVFDAQNRPVPVIPSGGIDGSGQFVDANQIVWNYGQDQNGNLAPRPASSWVYYTDANCTTPGYIGTSNSAYLGMSLSPNGTDHVYYTSDANVVTISLGYMGGPGSCSGTHANGQFVLLSDTVPVALPARVPGVPPYHLGILEN